MQSVELEVANCELLGWTLPAASDELPAFADGRDSGASRKTLISDIEKAEHAFGAGSLSRAEAFVERAISQFEDAAQNTRIMLLQVRLARESGDQEAAAKIVWALTERSQTEAKAAFALAQLALDRHASVELIGWLEIALGLQPDHEPSLVLIAQTFRRLQKQDRAYEMLGKATAIRPPLLPAHIMFGDMLQEDGRFAEAAEVYRTVLSISPGNPAAVSGLLATRGADGDAIVIDHANLLVTSIETPWQQRASVGYALAKCYDRDGDYANAYAQGSTANDLMRRRFPHDAAAEHARHVVTMENLKTFSDLELDTVSSSVRPIFIVGMPRSGTTLVEQILSAHPDVTGLGELSYWPRLAERWKLHEKDFTAPSGEEALAMAQRYRELLLARGATSGVAIDKLPDNYRFVSLIAALLPDAYFIHCVRDPRDNLVSIFFEHFSPQQTYVTAADDIVARREAHDSITAEWHRLYPDRMLRLGYEEFVQGGEGTMRSLVANIGLDWQDELTGYRTVARSVRTPSKHQVREALYNSSIDRWRNYEPWMKSAFDAFRT